RSEEAADDALALTLVMKEFFPREVRALLEHGDDLGDLLFDREFFAKHLLRVILGAVEDLAQGAHEVEHVDAQRLLGIVEMRRAAVVDVLELLGALLQEIGGLLKLL